MASKEPRQPRLRLSARFDPVVIMYRHPVRLSVSLAVPLLIFPELCRLAGWLTGFSGAAAGVVAALGIILLVFTPQFAASWLDCRFVRYDIYDDCLVFTENFFMRAPIRVNFRVVTDVQVTINPAQKIRGLADVTLTTQVVKGGIVGQAQRYVIPDLAVEEAQSARRVIAALAGTPPGMA